MNKKEKFKKILLFALMFLLPLISMSTTTIDSNNFAYTTEDTNIDIIHKISKDSIKSLIVSETATYIKKYHKTGPNNLSNILVTHGLNANIDICFMLAQTQLETTFGKVGIGRSTSRYSLFGIERKTYKNYEDATCDYIKILTTSYLVKNRTEQDLLKKYINKNGYRYAVNPKYEFNLKKVYDTIISNTRIKELQEQYKKL